MRLDPNRTQETRPGMGSLLARNWWTVALRGAIALLLGIAAFVWPTAVLSVLVSFFAAFLLVGGVFLIIAAVRERFASTQSWLLAVEGVLSIVLSVLVFVWPGLTAIALVYVIAFWSILTGVFEIIAAVQLRREIENEWLLAVAGVVAIAFGVVLAIWPGAGALTLLWLLAAYAVFYGIMRLILAFRLRTWDRRDPPPPSVF